MGQRWIDPYGCPEFLVTGIAYREMVGSDIIRNVYVAIEDGEPIAKVKLLWPVTSLLNTQNATTAFVRTGGLIYPVQPRLM